MFGMSRILTSSGVLSGVLLILLGVWGALIPFIGPYFHYAYTPDTAWHFTLPRLWLEVLPGVATALGGVLVIVSTGRLAAAGGAVLAALAGGWFAVGNAVSSLWPNLGTPGVPAGPASRIGLEKIGFFTGLGVVIVFVAAFTLGRLFAPAPQPGPVTVAATDSLPVEQ